MTENNETHCTLCGETLEAGEFKRPGVNGACKEVQHGRLRAAEQAVAEDGELIEELRVALAGADDAQRARMQGGVRGVLLEVCPPRSATMHGYVPERERIYLAMSATCWGKGLTERQAIDTCRRAGATAREKMVVMRMPLGAYGVLVDGMGSIHWFGSAQGARVEVLYRLVGGKKLPPEPTAAETKAAERKATRH